MACSIVALLYLYRQGRCGFVVCRCKAKSEWCAQQQLLLPLWYKGGGGGHEGTVSLLQQGKNNETLV